MLYALKQRFASGMSGVHTGIGMNVVAIATLLVSLVIFPAYLWAASATLTWEEPTTNADSTPLTDLAGYKVYCGTVAGTYTIIENVGRPVSCGTFPSKTCSVVVTNLASGKWYCAVTAYDTQTPPNESAKSNEVSKTIETTAPAAPVNK